ncbi:hypothetical protein HYH02_005434 [Chlamydomonas schloesseri]|uniref:Uncharacterized protein n=1 Tax=Chlamydomonas schloesseri TaxID=2026947 RepID=A0A835WKI9_9CHLO|nr:hypothetical protein HYH02_005434 [Chlamydomonas schloesseri]|eukprot:KAG2449277.1 hypothetical protein HYH02_005434 [Chlamydomonas schloesseri]
MALFVPDLPPEGAKTLWEDRCTLVSVDDAHDASNAAKLVPSVVLLGRDVPPELVPQRVAVYPPPHSDATSADAGEETGAGSGGASRPGATAAFLGASSGSGGGSLLGRLAAPLLAPLTGPLNLLWSTFLSGCQPRAAAPPLAWHPRQPWLAAADAWGRVQVLELPAAAAGAAGAGGRPPVANGGSRGELLLLGAAAAAAAGGAAGGAAAAAAGGSCRAVLAHEGVQPQALSLAWCPTSPGLLAVGSVGGVALWALSAAGEGRPPVAAAGRGSGPWLRHLRTRVPGARVTGLSWSPCGRLLAAASPGQAGLQVWEVASGTPAAVAAGPAAFDTVRWSPCGNYVFAAGTGSRHFYIFETQRWRWARWQTDGGASLTAPAAASTASATSPPPPPPASVVAAAWAPALPGRPAVLLAALSAPSLAASATAPGSSAAAAAAAAAATAATAAAPYLVAVHLVDAPPGLGAQLLPVALPDLQRAAAVAATATGGAAPGGVAAAGGGAGAASGPVVVPAVAVADMAWDAAGERLAVLVAPAAGAGAGRSLAAQVGLGLDWGGVGLDWGGVGLDWGGHCVALYGTTTDPLVSCRLLGFARPPAALSAAAAAAAAASGGQEAAAAGSSAAAASPPATPASLLLAPGGLCVARMGPSTTSAASAATGASPASGPAVVVSCRVGSLGVYNLPCYF